MLAAGYSPGEIAEHLGLEPRTSSWDQAIEYFGKLLPNNAACAVCGFLNWRAGGVSRRVGFVAFRSAKGNLFAERKATMHSVSKPLPRYRAEHESQR